jgi:hypothetical protein
MQQVYLNCEATSVVAVGAHTSLLLLTLLYDTPLRWFLAAQPKPLVNLVGLIYNR